MRCPSCQSVNTQVKDSRPVDDDTTIRRRRFCTDCGERFTTFERVQMRELMVIKSDQTQDMFDPEKLRRSIQIALRKRPVNSDELDKTVQEIVQKLEASGEQEITSTTIGETVMEVLKKLDEVAYVRFASVYKNFESADDFAREIKKL